MQAADQALEARRAQQADASLELFRQALDSESKAAALTRQQPSRSILFRSAANLAIEAGDYGRAEQLACLGLIGNPPEDIADELRHALDRATFRRHLRLGGVTLSPSAIQLSIAGPAVGYGDVPEPEIVSRVDAYRKLITRSVSRKRRIPFSESPHTRSEDADFQLFLSAPRAASFAVTLRVGAREMQEHFNFDVSPDAVVKDVMQNLRHFESEREQELRQAIPDGDYRRNFVALARKLAPDGKRITLVGVTRAADGVTDELAMMQPRASHQVRKPKASDAPIVSLEGRLNFADSPDGKKSGRIKLRTIDAEYKIAVPKGILSDIVRPHFDELVKIRARKRTAHTFEFVDFVD
jgi:hypothetical protein